MDSYKSEMACQSFIEYVIYEIQISHPMKTSLGEIYWKLEIQFEDKSSNLKYPHKMKVANIHNS